MPNITYKVEITATAEHQLDQIIHHILFEYCDEFAAESVYDDAIATKKRLEPLAGSIKISDDPDLVKYNYRIIKFKKHHYYMAYRLDGDTAVVDGIYHTLQDYSKDLISKNDKESQ